MIHTPLVLSATTLAKAYDLACPRFLIWSVDDIPRETVKWDETPGGKRLAEFGNQHEAEVVEKLTDGAPVHIPSFPKGDLSAGAEATRELLTEGIPFIAQAVFVGEIAPNIMLRGMADLVRKTEGPQTQYQIIEVKASEKLRTSQMLQAWSYGELLSKLLGKPQPDPVLIDRFYAVHAVPRQAIKPILEEFLFVTIPAWLSLGDNTFYRSGRCFSCPFAPTCLEDALNTNHLSLVSGLGPGIASRLRGIGGRDMVSLQDIKKGGLHSAGLESNYVRQFTGQAIAFLEKSRLRTRDRTPLPTSDVEIFLEAESDPTSSFPCRCGLLKRDRRKGLSAYRGVLLPGDEDEARGRARAFLDLAARQASRAAREGATWQVLFYGTEMGERLSRLGEWAGWGHDLVEEILIKAVDVRSLIRRMWHLPVEHYDFSSVLDAIGLNNPADDTPGFVLHMEWKTQVGEEAETFGREILKQGELSTRALMELWDWLTASWAEDDDG